MNATGRLSTAKLAIDLLVEEDMDRIHELAKDLVELNNTRKKLTQEGLEKCDDIVKENSYDKNDVIVVYEPSIDESICGIVAGRIKEKYYRPTIVLTDSSEDGILKGSGRSISTYNMHGAILPYDDKLKSFGGHPMACGLSIKKELVGDFREFLNRESKLTKDDLEEVINIDTQINISKLSLEFAESLDKLRPFGKDNPRPIFANKGVDIADIQMIGKNKNTMRLSLYQNGRYFTAIKFNAVADLDYLNLKFNNTIKGNKIDIVYYPDINEFNGKRTLQIRLVDIR